MPGISKKLVTLKLKCSYVHSLLRLVHGHETNVFWLHNVFVWDLSRTYELASCLYILQCDLMSRNNLNVHTQVVLLIAV